MSDRLSQFLPEDFSAQRGLTVIAGKGDYPVMLIDALRRHGVRHSLVAFREETREDLIDSFETSERRVIKVGQLGKMLAALRTFDSGYAIMAGQITPRRLFKGLHPDFKAVRILASLRERNAESIFGAIAAEIEAIGVTQLDARAFLDDQLALPGAMTSARRALPDSDDLDYGIRICRSIADLNIGQGVVVSNGTTLAVEAFEGTDAMLLRAGTFDSRAPLFVKCVKPSQDYRFDVPVFGSKTLATLQQADIRCAALEAGKVILLNRDKLTEEAATAGIQLYGF